MLRGREEISALPRVLQCLRLIPGVKFGSIEEQIVLQSRAFASAGAVFVPLFNAPVGSSIEDFARRGLQAHTLDMENFSIEKLKTLASIVRQHRIDIVNWSFFEPISNPYLWGLSAICPGVRHWFTDHISRVEAAEVPPTGLRLAMKRTLAKRYENVLCVSGFVRECMQRQRAWPRLSVLPHFVNTARFSPNAATRLAIRDREDAGEHIVLLYAGQLIPEKGIDVVIRSMPRLPPNVMLWIAGHGPEREMLQGLAATCGVDSRVKFFAAQPDVSPLMQAADVFVCPSLWHEAAGLVNLEAQACGLPVIASRIGGIPEYVADGRTGYLVDPGSVEAFTQALAALCQDDGLRRSMSEAARAWAVERFSPEACMPQYVSLYAKYHRRAK